MFSFAARGLGSEFRQPQLDVGHTSFLARREADAADSNQWTVWGANLPSDGRLIALSTLRLSWLKKAMAGRWQINYIEHVEIGLDGKSDGRPMAD